MNPCRFLERRKSQIQDGYSFATSHGPEKCHVTECHVADYQICIFPNRNGSFRTRLILMTYNSAIPTVYQDLLTGLVAWLAQSRCPWMACFILVPLTWEIFYAAARPRLATFSVTFSARSSDEFSRVISADEASTWAVAISVVV